MSRHTLVDEPDCEIVTGFDAPLRSFFAQRFDPNLPTHKDELVAGWPTPRGLGILPRVETEEQATLALGELAVWLQANGVPRNKAALIVIVLRNEWREAPDRGEPLLSRIIREACGGGVPPAAATGNTVD